MEYFVNASRNYDVEYKVIIIGESRVGKINNLIDILLPIY